MSDDKIEMNSKSPLVQKGNRKLYKSTDSDVTDQADANVRRKLAQRQTLSDRKRRVNDAVTALAILGLIIVVVTTELNLNDAVTRGGTVQLTLLGTVTVSIIILEILLIW